MKKPVATQWKIIEGTWKWPYRISDQGDVQRQLPSGRWRDLKPYMYSGQLRIQMWVDDTKWKRVQISKLVADAFMGGTPPGMLRVHKNRMRHDNAKSSVEAAKKNYISQQAISRRCLGKVADPYNLDGCNYVFADSLESE